MQHERIYLYLARMSDTGMEEKYIHEAFASRWVTALGPNVDGFEADLERYINGNEKPGSTTALSSKKHIAVFSSCTAAIHLALLQLGVGKGDEVLCQDFTFCASCNPVVYCGARPVFVDSEPDTWNIDPVLLEQAILDRIATTGRKPKAIIVVDLYGMPARWDELERISQHYGIPIIEDAANALGSFYDGRPCGTFGMLRTFSFNGNKIITTSGGGALVCDDEAIKKHTVFLATQAREPFHYYQHETIGYNYRMSNICAGIGRGQMTLLDDRLKHQKHIHGLYKEMLDVEGIMVHDNPSGKHDSNHWLTTILLDSSVIKKDVEELCVMMDQAGIEARVLWKPMHLQPVYKEAVAYVNGISESLFRHGLCLPSGPYVSDEDVAYIVECLKQAIR